MMMVITMTPVKVYKDYDIPNLGTIDSRSGRYQVVTTMMGNQLTIIVVCLRAGKPSRHITNSTPRSTQPFIPPG